MNAVTAFREADVTDEAEAALPPAAAAKVDHLGQIRADAYAVSRAASDSASDKGALLRQRRDELERHTAHKGIKPPENDPQIVRLKAAISRLSGEVDELRRTADARAQRAHMVGALHQRVTAALNHLLPDAVLKAHPPVAAKLGKGETGVDAIERLRRTISDVRAEEDRLRALPLTVDEVKARIGAEVDRLAEAGRPGIAAMTYDGGGEIAWPKSVRAGGYEIDALGLLAWIDPEALKTKLGREVDAQAPKDGIPAADRAKQLADLERRRLAAEREEESLIVLMEDQGFSMVRRPEADLRAVLGLTAGSLAGQG